MKFSVVKTLERFKNSIVKVKKILLKEIKGYDHVEKQLSSP